MDVLEVIADERGFSLRKKGGGRRSGANELLVSFLDHSRGQQVALSFLLKVIRPCARTNGDRPPFIKYLETTPLDAHNTAVTRQATAPLVVKERGMIATVKT